MKTLVIIVILGNIVITKGTFKDVVLKVLCVFENPDEQYLPDCIQTSQPIEVLDNEANANATLVCRDVEYITLAHNPGIFVIEHRSNKNAKWNNAIESNGSMISVYGLRAETQYQFRFHRLLENGVSRPEVTNWYKTMKYLHEVQEPTDITVLKYDIDPEMPLHLKSQISFSPAEDRSCFYEVICGDSSNHIRPAILNKTLEYKVTFVNLTFDTEYVIMVTAQTQIGNRSRRAQIYFVTPTCIDFLRNITICPPSIIEVLNATMIHKVGDIYDIKITWSIPELIPILYDVQLEVETRYTWGAKNHNISGTTNNTLFSNVKIIEDFEACIRALSPGGWGPTFCQFFTLTKETVDLTGQSSISPNFGTIIVTFLASVVLVIGAGAYVYYRREKRNLNQERSKYPEDRGKMDAALGAMKDIGDADPITIKKRLLTPVDEYEVSPDRLEIKRVLGSGAFGVVKLGSLLDDRGQVIDVAVKMLHDDPNKEDIRSFELEIKVMKSAGQHPNIVSLIGCCTIGPRPLLIVEYCARGDLQSFLRSILEKATTSIAETKKLRESSPQFVSCNKILDNISDESFSTYLNCKDEVPISISVVNRAYDIDRAAICDNDTVTVTDLLNFGRQIAIGMEFLSSNRVVHRDLAARNVLVCNDRTVKISDFGLSRDIYQENIYKKRGNGRLPIKWMAIEALTHQVYSTYSDVWSFGILLWEIVTLGSNPYPDIPANGVLRRLRSGYRMERPANCSIPLYNVMLSCWQTKPKDRPMFTTLRQELDKLIRVAAKNEYLDLNDASKETPPDYEESQITTSRYIYVPLQPRYVNDRNPGVVPNDEV